MLQCLPLGLQFFGQRDQGPGIYLEHRRAAGAQSEEVTVPEEKILDLFAPAADLFVDGVGKPVDQGRQFLLHADEDFCHLAVLLDYPFQDFFRRSADEGTLQMAEQQNHRFEQRQPLFRGELLEQLYHRRKLGGQPQEGIADILEGCERQKAVNLLYQCLRQVAVLPVDRLLAGDHVGQLHADDDLHHLAAFRLGKVIQGAVQQMVHRAGEHALSAVLEGRPLLIQRPAVGVVLSQGAPVGVLLALFTLHKVFPAGVVVQKKADDRVFGVVVVQLARQLGIGLGVPLPHLIVDAGAVEVIQMDDPVAHRCITHDVRRGHIVAALGMPRQEDVLGGAVLQIGGGELLGRGAVLVVGQLEILVPAQLGAIGAPHGDDRCMAAVVYVHRHGRPLGAFIFGRHVVDATCAVAVGILHLFQQGALAVRKADPRGQRILGELLHGDILLPVIGIHLFKLDIAQRCQHQGIHLVVVARVQELSAVLYVLGKSAFAAHGRLLSSFW